MSTVLVIAAVLCIAWTVYAFITLRTSASVLMLRMSGMSCFRTSATVASDPDQHHWRCSYRAEERGMLCDCAASSAAVAAWVIAKNEGR